MAFTLNERGGVEGAVVAGTRFHPRAHGHGGDAYPIAAEFGRIVIRSGSGRNVVKETIVLARRVSCSERSLPIFFAIC